MTDIDPSTGLPALKEGRFWRVRERHPDWFVSSICLVVELVEQVEVENRTRVEFLGIPLWSKTPITVVEENTLAYQVLWNPNLPVVEKDYTGWSVEVDGLKYHPLQTGDLTPSIILEGARKALEWYERKIDTEKLLGDYPPKNLSTDA